MHDDLFVDNVGDESLNGNVRPQSFSERRAIERSRRVIKGYQHSRLGNGIVERNEYFRQAERPPGPSPETRQLPSERTVRPPIQQPSTFREPPSRGYNPYS